MKHDGWKAWLSFSKRERAALLVLLFCTGLFLFIPRFYHAAPPLLEIDTAAERQLSFITVNTAMPAGKDSVAATAMPAVLFRFDPNTLPAEGWQKLGLHPRVIQTILHYRAKGGVFRRPEDLRKLYGLRPEEATRLIPYVVIDSAFSRPHYAARFAPVQTTVAPANALQPLDINEAGAQQWEALPGIGPVLSNRIVRFREKLGGFTRIEQVKQTYGLRDSVFERIRPWLRMQTAGTGKININTAGVAQLKNNPHIPPGVAEAIVLYRQQHGLYQSVDDLKKIVFITDTLFAQIAPYLTVAQHSSPSQ